MKDQRRIKSGSKNCLRRIKEGSNSNKNKTREPKAGWFARSSFLIANFRMAWMVEFVLEVVSNLMP